MKIVCLSDTHLQHNFTVPDGDVLVHAGDATWRGTPEEITVFAGWFAAFPHKHKIFVAGNHDWLFEKNPQSARNIMLRAGITYLEDSGCEIAGLKFWGSPWQPEFGGWAFNLSRLGTDLRDKWALIPTDTNVLITHGPPRGILDLTLPRMENVGCWDMRERLRALPKLRLHVFGHIHAAYGESRQADIDFVNASICDEDYNPTNPPIVKEITP